MRLDNDTEEYLPYWESYKDGQRVGLIFGGFFGYILGAL